MQWDFSCWARRLLMFVLPLALCACAGLTVEGVGNSGQTTDADARGVRFYQQAPFLFVFPDGEGGTSAEVKWLPDTTQLMSAKPYAVLASNQTTLEFSGSAITSATLVTDETTVVKASLEALGKLLAAANTREADALAPVPKLYRIVVNGDGRVVGLGESVTLDVHGKPFSGK